MRRQRFMRVYLVVGVVAGVLLGCTNVTSPSPPNTEMPTATLLPKAATATPSAVLATMTAPPTLPRPTWTPTLAVTKLIAFMASPVEKANPDIFTMAPDGSKVTNLTRHPAEDRLPAWAPDGTQLAFISSRADGLELYVMNVDGSNVRQVTQGRRLLYYRPSWSPDGKAVAFTARSEADRKAIFEVNLESLEIMALINEKDSNNNSPAWSPDGSALAFVSDRNAGIPQIFVLSLATNELRQVTTGDLPNSQPAWSPDGREIAYTCLSPRSGVICIINRDGAHYRRLIDPDLYLDGYEPTWSPDGKYIAFRSVRDTLSAPGTTSDIYVMDTNGNNTIRLTGGLAFFSVEPAWQP